MRVLHGLISVSVLVTIGSAVDAQYVYSPPVYSPLNAITSDVRYQGIVSSLNDNVNNQIVDQDEFVAEGGGATSASLNVTFTYQSDPARTQQNLRNFIARTPNPSARAELERMIAAQPSIIGDIGEGIAIYGYDARDVSDAYAMWWIMVWLASEVSLKEPDREMAQNVSRQVRAAFAATPEFENTDDAQRQEYAEALLLQAMILAELIKAADANPEVAAQLPAIARKGAKASGIDLSLMKLTQDGFVPRKGADASGAVEGDDTIRNARTDTPAAAGESSSLGLALAAGAGLGVTLLGGLALMRRG
jgi:hypothetical protein